MLINVVCFVYMEKIGIKLEYTLPLIIRRNSVDYGQLQTQTMFVDNL